MKRFYLSIMLFDISGSSNHPIAHAESAKADTLVPATPKIIANNFFIINPPKLVYICAIDIRFIIVVWQFENLIYKRVDQSTFD